MEGKIITDSRREAILALYSERGDKMRLLAKSMIEELGDPDDVVSSALATLHAEGSADPDRFTRLVMDEARELRRQVLRLREREVPVGLLTDLADIEERLSQGSRDRRPFFAETFDQAVRGLPDNERDAWLLTELRGVTDRDAAELLGVSHMTVNRRSTAAIIRIREELAA